ncbi:hypothetical protein [Urbifossiella limnaea]|uniref:SGNH/GDSL hydrolase family protein n=1 Tax=Urbifossiella limnaea TaxID=2528023 RepID=A0A517Y041_9BACT|nr:hypothetical protein [Urbifossiella limnaea]QDU23113.1 hypothetical protein ETAA1_51040 [Urbifossiella limnaea]
MFVVAVIGLAGAVETVKPEWRDPEYGHRLRQLRALRAAHPGRPLVLAVGSSRTQMGVSPAAMGLRDALAYNFGQSAAGPLRIHLTVERLAAEGIVPDVLLVEFFPAAFAHDGPAEEQLKGMTARLSLADVRRLEPFTADAALLHRRWAAARANSWHSLRLVLMNHARPDWLPWRDRLTHQWDMLDPYGFSPHPHESISEPDREQSIRRVRDQYAWLLSDYRIGAASDRVFRDLLERCRARGVRVVLFRTPEGPSFRALAAGAEPAARAFLAGVGVPLIEPDGDYAEADFADGHHPLRPAAERFSRQLGAAVRP